MRALITLCSVYCVVCTKQSQRSLTGLRLCNRNAIITSMWKGTYDSDRNYRREWERLVHKAADGSECKLWHHFTQSVQFHKT